MRRCIGVMSCSCDFGGEPGVYLPGRYVGGISERLGADILLIPPVPAAARAGSVLARLDGIIFTGSPSNIEPTRYGAGDGAGPFDPSRDRVALDLIREAGARRLPMLGICRGMQEINVALGGTLQDGLGSEAGKICHHAPADIEGPGQFSWSHPLDVASGGLLHDELRTGTAQVNSIHFQGIATLGQGLRVEASAPDGVIEAIAAEDRPIYAVQWHPEMSLESRVSQAVFSIFARMLDPVSPPPSCDGFALSAS